LSVANPKATTMERNAFFILYPSGKAEVHRQEIAVQSFWKSAG